MNKRPLKPCHRIGCTELTRGRFCGAHSQDARSYDRNRQSSSQRGYDREWRKARADYLVRNPICVECASDGKVTGATVVDHEIPHKGDRAIFWDTTRWRALCKTHHDSKTAREDGGFGNDQKTLR
ncbi:HNH endonuclease signature motif containing protein [Paenibacillus sp. FSL H8-0317]|uniref:HNH endonuclease signature motif containing protein n=1 Tax=Paenibacillus sp. FSL H8-0317 TaxID=2921385 RepID=UPI003243E65B